MRNTALLQIRDLTVRFSDSVPPAVRAVSIRVDTGTRVGIIGESGSGKSVTAMSILRLNDERIARYGDESSITLDGEEILKAPISGIERARGAKVSMIFQDPMSVLNPVFRVGHQVRDVLVAHRPEQRKKARAFVVDSLDAVGIRNPAEVYRKYPHELSGGMRQRVMIAMAIASSPKLLIADEATSALDVTVQAAVLETIGTLADDRGMAVLMITHDMGVVARFCDFVYVMYHGQVVESGAAADILTSPQHEYTQKLLASVPRLDAHRFRTA